MDSVRTFNNELSSLYECKPPISKAKMTSVTKTAIKAIKFYKHVVQSVEKFVQKCKSEYKVPGLYVVDSIVRQSRHQYGTKDVFAPRFAKNINITFQNLFKCPPEEKSKIVRVLNLWQKNNVFTSDVIQPLLDMANPNHPVHQQSTPVASDTPTSLTSKTKDVTSGWSGWNHDPAQLSQLDPTNTLKTVSQLIQQTQSAHMGSIPPILDNNVLNQLQQITNLLTQAQVKGPEEENAVKFNKKLLDFDYGDEDDEDEEKKEDLSSPGSDPTSLAVSMAQNLLSNPELLRQLQQMQHTIQQTEALKNEMSVQEQLHKQRLRQQEEEFSQQIQTAVTLEPQQQYDPASFTQLITPNSLVSHPNMQAFVPVSPALSQPPQMVHMVDAFPSQDQDERQGLGNDDDRERSRSPRRRDRTRSRSRSPSKSRTRKRSRRSRSRSKSPRRRRSRSRSGSRSRMRHRRERRSRSREREKEKEREREREKEREKERERKKRGLPPIKRDYLSVCSTTLWLGHVSKLVSEEDLADTFGEFGDIVAIDMIPPRGCAFVCMNRRQDAYRALQKLKSLKLQGKTITMAWAPGKGVKGKDFKDYWDADLGVSYIPYEKLPNGVNLDALEEGGMVDDDTIPERLKEQQKLRNKENSNAGDKQDGAFEEVTQQGGIVAMQTGDQTNNEQQQQPQHQTSSLPLIQPLVTTQFGMTVPGLVPGQPMPMMSIPMGVPPPTPMVGMMVPPVSQSLLNQTMPMVGPMPVAVQQTFAIPTPTGAPPSATALLDNPADDDTPTQESQENSPDGMTNADTKSLTSPAAASAMVSSSAPINCSTISGTTACLTSQTSVMDMNSDFAGPPSQGFQTAATFNPSLPPPSFRPANFDMNRSTLPLSMQENDCNATPSEKDSLSVNSLMASNWHNKPGDSVNSMREMGQDVDMRGHQGMNDNHNNALLKDNNDLFDNPNCIPLGIMKSSMQDMAQQQRSRPMGGLMDASPQNMNMMRSERSLADRLHGHAGYNPQPPLNAGPGLLPQPDSTGMMGVGSGNRVMATNMDRMPMHDRLQGTNPGLMIDHPRAGLMDGGPMGMDRNRGPEHMGMMLRGGPFRDVRPNMFQNPGLRFGGPRMPNGPGIMGPGPQFGRFPGMGSMNRSQMGGIGGVPQDAFPPRGMVPRGGMMFPGNPRGGTPFLGGGGGGGGGGMRTGMDRMGLNMDRPPTFGMDHSRLANAGPDFRDDRFAGASADMDRFDDKWKRHSRMDDDFRDNYPPNNDWRREDDYDREYMSSSRDRYGRERRDRDKDKSRDRDRERAGRGGDDRDWNRSRDYGSRRNNDDRGHGRNDRESREDRDRSRKSRWSDGERKNSSSSSNNNSSNEMPNKNDTSGETSDEVILENNCNGPMNNTTNNINNNGDNNDDDHVTDSAINDMTNNTTDKLLDEPMNIDTCESVDETPVSEVQST